MMFSIRTRCVIAAIVVAAVAAVVIVTVPEARHDQSLQDLEPGAKAFWRENLEAKDVPAPQDIGDLERRAGIGRRRDAFEVNGLRVRLHEAVATGKREIWGPVITELRDPQIKREDAIAILSGCLNEPSWELRMDAADILMLLGSPNAVPVLRAALTAAAQGEMVPNWVVSGAVETLYKYREPLDSSLLYKLVEQGYKGGRH